jgi:fructose-1,6-bisphosphatase I
MTEERVVTLPDFIRANERKYPNASGHFSNILLSIALSTKILSRGVNRAGLAAMMGLTGETNVQGEAVQKLDVYADQVFAATLGRSGEFISMVSEEREALFPASDGGSQSKYVIAFDPLDGSSNIDVNVAIGSIWGIYRRVSDGVRVDAADCSDFFQPGSDQVAAGYTIYGSSTMFVFTTGQDVNGFTLDPTIGEFILTHPKMTIPQTGTIYSCNEANRPKWSKGVEHFLQQMANRSSKVSQRYVGSMVADLHRTLLKGGIFLYPGEAKKPEGKLRLLYECAPMALLCEKAGGRASDGRQPILDLVPNSIHQRTPLFIGSAELVAELERAIAEHG